MAARRKSIDCRDYPSEKNCSLKISGTEEEVLDAAVQHAAAVHGHENTPELREQIKQMLAIERSCRGSRSAFSDSRPLFLCFDVEFCK